MIAPERASRAHSEPAGSAERDWLGFAQLREVVVALAGIAGLVSFVVFVGGVVVWARFEAVQLPATEALTEVNKVKLLVVGAQALVPAVISAAVLLVPMYAFNRQGESSLIFSVILGAVLLAYPMATLLLTGDDGSLALAAGFLILEALAVFALLRWGLEEQRTIESQELAERDQEVVGSELVTHVTTKRVETEKRNTSARSWPVIGLASALLIAGGVIALRLASPENLVFWAGLTVAVVAVAISYVVVRQTEGFRPVGWIVFVSLAATGAALAVIRSYETPKLEGVAIQLKAEGGKNNKKPPAAAQTPETRGYLVTQSGDELIIARPRTDGTLAMQRVPTDEVAGVAFCRDQLAEARHRRAALGGCAPPAPEK